FRRTLLDRGLLPDLERLLSGEEPGAAPSGAPRSRLLEHIEANLLYYSTAIISAGDPAARYVALSKLRDPAGRPLTDVVENTVIGRVGNAIALPLRSEEHTSELQSRFELVCRLLLETKNSSRSTLMHTKSRLSVSATPGSSYDS